MWKKAGRKVFPQDFSTESQVVVNDLRPTDCGYVATLEGRGESLYRVTFYADDFSRSLTVGSVVSAADVRRAAEPAMAFWLALKAIERRACTGTEISRALARRGYDPAVTSATRAKLESLGLLDDGRFAEAFVRSRLGARAMSPWMLRRDLARKGIDRETADRAIRESMADREIDEASLAQAQAERKWKSLSKLDSGIARRRLAAFLQRRGFSGDAIRVVIQRVAG